MALSEMRSHPASRPPKSSEMDLQAAHDGDHQQSKHRRVLDSRNGSVPALETGFQPDARDRYRANALGRTAIGVAADLESLFIQGRVEHLED